MTPKHQEWSTFRITTLLYAIIFIIPFLFYFIHASFDDIQQDSKIVKEVGWAEGVMDTLLSLENQKPDPHTVARIDHVFQEVGIWVNNNQNSKFYIGGSSLQKDFADAHHCWTSYKDDLQKHQAEQHLKKGCSHTLKTLSLIITNMIYLKEKDLVNMFYWYLAIAMLLAILMIYFVRAYIHQQLKKHAIHDHETKLYNKKYLMAELRSTCARAERYDYPLTLLSIAVEGLENGTYEEKEKAHLLEQLGGILISMTRTSDVACRYDENHLVVMLPFTEEKNAKILQDRIETQLETHDFMLSSKPNFRLSLIGFSHGESPEACIERADNFLKA